MKRVLVLVAIACIAIISLQAQIITWAVKPGVYSKIEPCWEDLYLVYKGNSVGVINGNGNVVVSPEASRITGFYDGLSLVLKSIGGKERVLGILSTDGIYTNVNGTYYTIPNQEFFSEGLLTVTDSRGLTGYMNGNGSVVESFEASYISPFSEGYAVVGAGQGDFRIIDKRFNTLSIQLPTYSPLWNGTNVYKGVSIVWDGNGKIFEFDPKRGSCSPVKNNSIKRTLQDSDYNPDWDYLGGIAVLTNRSKTVSYDISQRTFQTLPVTEQGNKYGYVINDKIILPCQFDQAESFHGNFAIVQLNGKYALLSLHNANDFFNAKAINSEIKYKKSSVKNLVHKFGISIPNLWSMDNVLVKVKDENNIPINIVKDGSTFEFKSDGASGTKKYNIELESEGLKLWGGEIAYHYTMERDIVIDDGYVGGTTKPNFKSLSVRLEKGNTQANEKNLCCVKACISNPNPENITTKVMWTGSSLLEGSNTTVTVPANGSKIVTIYLKVLKAQSGQSVTVTTNAGGRDTISGLQLIPF